MAEIYNNVRGLAGAIMTGLGKVSQYLGSQLQDETKRIGWISRRYPNADASAVLEMENWVLNATAAGEIMTAGLTPPLPGLPSDYPQAPTRYLYHVMATIPSATGNSQFPPFYSIITSNVPLTQADLLARVMGAAQQAAQNASGKSPGAEAVAAAKQFDISILSIWQE